MHMAGDQLGNVWGKKERPRLSVDLPLPYSMMLIFLPFLYAELLRL